MADLLPPAERPGEPVVYKPVSGLALVGLILSLLFAAVVLVSTAVALAQGAPLYLAGWVLGIAVAAALMSFIAQLRIRNAEGTLAGLPLARWGLWVSVLVGVTYFVYSWVTGLALAKQANDFLLVKADDDSGFLPRLLNARKNQTDLYHAFLLSLPATSRGGSKPDREDQMLFQFDQSNPEGGPGQISSFRTHPLVLALSRDPAAVTIEPLRVLEWKYEQNSYHVYRNYRFTTPEAVIEHVIPVQSTEGVAQGDQRKWFVALVKTKTLNSVKFTPVGNNLMALRTHGRGSIDQWRSEVMNGKPVPEYKEADSEWGKVFPKPGQQKQVQKIIKETFAGERRPTGILTTVTDEQFGDWYQEQGRIHLVQVLRWFLPGADGLPNFSLDFEVIIATKEPVDLAVLGSPPIWEVRKVRFIRAAVAERPPGGPPG